MKKWKYLVAGVSAVTLGAAGVLLSPLAHADVTAPVDIARTADAAFDAWNNAFLVRAGNGDTYYADTLTNRGTSPAKWFVAALDIAVAQDVYQRTRRPEHRQLANDLVKFFIKDNGKDWTPNSWNDDMAWMTLTAIRGYQTSGDPELLTIAADNWNKTFNRGWNPVGGGGIWEDNNRFDRGKCALSNNPMITAAVQLYQITGDNAYLTKSIQIYDWVRRTLVDTATGQVNGCVFFADGDSGPARVEPSDNVYDAGSLIEAANLLYRVTGNYLYYQDAQRSADHIVATVPIIHQNQGRGTSYQYRFFRGLSEFCTDNNICDRYRGYLLANANSAWNNRDSAGLMWNDWTRPTNAANPDAFEMASAVALWQQIPTTGDSAFAGNYQIRNIASNRLLSVRDSSTADAAPIVQTDNAGDPSTLWTLVHQSNGQYQIRNVHSGQAVNVGGASGKLQATVVQWPGMTMREANDKWSPVRNSDGTYTFYSRSSQLALDNPAGGTAVGTQYIQWSPTDGAPQRFELIRR
ncbi:RICIN domain-containing protein [Micromonosporaceae bacterium Da 78-11]